MKLLPVFLFCSLVLSSVKLQAQNNWSLEIADVESLVAQLHDTTHAQLRFINHTHAPLLFEWTPPGTPLEMERYSVLVGGFADTIVPFDVVLDDYFYSRIYSPFRLQVTSPSGHIAPSGSYPLLEIPVSRPKLPGTNVQFYFPEHYVGIDQGMLRIDLENRGTVPVNVVVMELADTTDFRFTRTQDMLGFLDSIPEYTRVCEVSTKQRTITPRETILRALCIDSGGDSTWVQTRIVAGGDLGNSSLVANADTLWFSPLQNTHAVSVSNPGIAELNVDTIFIEADTANAFSIESVPILPFKCAPLQTLRLKVNARGIPDSTAATAVLRIVGRGLEGELRTDSVVLMYNNNMPMVDVVDVTMQSTNANIGETTIVTLSPTSASAPASALLPSAHYCIVAITYNASVLVPQDQTLDAQDSILNGFRTSRFRLTVERDVARGTWHLAPGTLRFTTALGNSSSTPLTITQFDWFDADNNKLDIQTNVNGSVVSVLDARGSEVNAYAGPLSLTIHPQPLHDISIVHYKTGGQPATLRVFDQIGGVAMDLTSQLKTQEGAIALYRETLSAGRYALWLCSGVHTFVIPLVVE